MTRYSEQVDAVTRAQQNVAGGAPSECRPRENGKLDERDVVVILGRARRVLVDFALVHRIAVGGKGSDCGFFRWRFFF